MELFEGLTESEIDYLKYLQKQKYFDGIEMFLNLDTSSDYRIEKFIENGYIVLEDNGPYDGSCYVTITEKGIAALVDYDKYCKSRFRQKLYSFFSLLFAILGVIIAAIALVTQGQSIQSLFQSILLVNNRTIPFF